MSINYEILPQHLRQEALQYIQNGTQPGELIAAVIKNDLSDALYWAREMEATDRRFEGFDAMAEVEQFFRTEAPEECMGSWGRMDAWMQRRKIEAAERQSRSRAIDRMINGPGERSP